MWYSPQNQKGWVTQVLSSDCPHVQALRGGASNHVSKFAFEMHLWFEAKCQRIVIKFKMQFFFQPSKNHVVKDFRENWISTYTSIRSVVSTREKKCPQFQGIQGKAAEWTLTICSLSCQRDLHSYTLRKKITKESESSYRMSPKCIRHPLKLTVMISSSI